MKQKILPCPLCAGESCFIEIRDGGGVVQCECCGCEGVTIRAKHQQGGGV